MIERIIEEIELSIENNCYMSALAMALLLPDICGKAEYPDLKPRDRYIKWFDDFVLPIDPFHNMRSADTISMNRELIYSLRCSVMHEGNPSVDEKKLELNYFELIWNKEKNGNNMGITERFEGKYDNDENGNDILVEKKYSLNIRYIIESIKEGTLLYYKNNQEKFNFFNYKIVSSDFNTREIFDLQK